MLKITNKKLKEKGKSDCKYKNKLKVRKIINNSFDFGTEIELGKKINLGKHLDFGKELNFGKEIEN